MRRGSNASLVKVVNHAHLVLGASVQSGLHFVGAFGMPGARGLPVIRLACVAVEGGAWCGLTPSCKLPPVAPPVHGLVCQLGQRVRPTSPATPRICVALPPSLSAQASRLRALSGSDRCPSRWLPSQRWASGPDRLRAERAIRRLGPPEPLSLRTRGVGEMGNSARRGAGVCSCSPDSCVNDPRAEHVIVNTSVNADFSQGNRYALPRHAARSGKADPVASREDGGVCVGDPQSCAGTIRYPNGDVYTGEWRASRAAGYGRVARPDSSTYEGQWAGDAAHGEGTETFPDGSWYRGRYSHGSKSGFGMFHWVSGPQFCGQFEDNVFHGEGSYYWGDGRVYTGQWVRNEFSGHGRMSWPDGQAPPPPAPPARVLAGMRALVRAGACSLHVRRPRCARAGAYSESDPFQTLRSPVLAKRGAVRRAVCP